METWEELESPLRTAADELTARLGRPRAGVVLGSGFGPFTSALGTPVQRVRFAEIPGLLAPRVNGHDAEIEAYPVRDCIVWVFRGRLHLYEGHSAPRVVQAARALAFAGAEAVLLTCAAGGLLESQSPGDLAIVEDHLNLTGTDPLATIPPERRRPVFVDLQGVYDADFLATWTEAAGEHGIRLRPAVLAAVHGPCYETPAEVRMLRTLGAHVVTMSTVPESIAAHHLGLRVAALACVANAAAGMAPGRLCHQEVLDTVSSSSASRGAFFRKGLEEMIGVARP